MKIENLFDFKKIFTSICNLKYYVSWNLIALIGYLDFLYCVYFYSVAMGPERFSAGDIMLIFSVYYSIFTRAAFFVFFISFIIERSKGFKFKKNNFMDNNIYETLFFIGLIVFFAFSLIILMSIIYILIIILLFY